MGWSKKKADPLSERAKALSDQIAALEAQIKQLDARVDVRGNGNGESAPSAPRLRSTAMPHGAATVVHASPPVSDEPIFEEVNQNRLKTRTEPVAPEQFNDIGVRKYDLAGFIDRLKNHFRGPPTMNPKLVNYLAAGSIQGLRPMRYEKRVARNRVIALVVVILLVLVGLWAILPHR